MEFRIEKACVKEADRIASLIEKVWEQLENRDWFAADNAEYTYQMLISGKGIAYKAIDISTEKLAGVFMTMMPGFSEENLGRDIGISTEWLEQTVHMESVAVLPEYRGYRLQRLLMQEAEKDLRRFGYRYLVCAIHPDNIFSKRNVLALGYCVVKTTEKYGGLIRDIMLKELL